MSKTTLQFLLLGFILVLAQVVVFNHIYHRSHAASSYFASLRAT